MFKNRVVRRVIQTFSFSLAACLLSMPVASAQGLPPVQKHMFQTADATRLVADIYVAKQAGDRPCAILLHQLGKTKADMVPLVAPLLAQGFTVINLDMRGHGSSQGRKATKVPYTTFTNADWAELPQDLSIVLHNIGTVPKLDTEKFAMIGASIGANAVIMEASRVANVKAVVLLSPGMDFHGLKPALAMAALRRPALIVAAKDDAYSAESALKLSKMDSRSSFDLLPQGGHGSQMFASHPELPQQIATWLHKAMP